jgi:hypothetical protein
MARRATKLRIILLLLLDAVSTILLAYLTLVAVGWIFDVTVGILVYGKVVGDLIGGFGTIASALRENPGTRIFVFASLFTSIWVWLYVLASVSVRGLHGILSTWKKILPVLDIEKKPMVAIGRVAGLIAAVGYLAVVGGLWALHHL